jgi:hypothetical protein
VDIEAVEFNAVEFEAVEFKFPRPLMKEWST